MPSETRKFFLAAMIVVTEQEKRARNPRKVNQSPYQSYLRLSSVYQRTGLQTNTEAFRNHYHVLFEVLPVRGRC